ncbi:MAG TPA: DUF3467 domain-containing protein [Anaerolineales bacterium]|jgi:hypothetical protein|nr:DUF3467 domain-containing protein [Anaerolineales bacterium]
MKPDPSPPHPQPEIEVPEGLEPIYVNVARIAHAPSELILEFAHVFPGSPKAQVKSRLVMSPMSAKLFFRALGENLARYEGRFGEIALPGDASLAEYSKLFKPPDTPKGD